MADPTPTPVPKPKRNAVDWISQHPFWSVLIALAVGAASTFCVMMLVSRPTPPTPMPPPAISLPEKLVIDPASPIGRITPTLADGVTGLKWMDCPTNCCIQTMTSEGDLLIVPIPGKQGVSYVGAVAIRGGAIVGPVYTKVLVGAVPPVPPIPPNPPDPPVPPTPPTPFPGVTGLHALIVYKTKDLPSYPDSQQLILTAQSVRDLLAAKCAKDGSQPCYRIWPDDVSGLETEPKWLQDAIKLPHASLPWIFVGDAKTGISQALPTTVDDTLKLLQKFSDSSSYYKKVLP